VQHSQRVDTIEQNVVQAKYHTHATKQRVDRQGSAHFSLWLKESHGGFKPATKTEDAEG